MESEKIKVKHNRVKQMTLIISLLFSLSSSKIFCFMCFKLNVSVILIHYNHHHHHQQQKILRMAKKQFNLLRCNKNNLRETSMK